MLRQTQDMDAYENDISHEMLIEEGWVSIPIFIQEQGVQSIWNQSKENVYKRKNCQIRELKLMDEKWYEFGIDAGRFVSFRAIHDVDEYITATRDFVQLTNQDPEY